MKNTDDRHGLLPSFRTMAPWLRSMMLLFVLAAAASGWQQDEFVIFTFFDPCLSPCTDTANAAEADTAHNRFRMARDASFTLLTATQFPPHIVETEAGMDYGLFIAGKVPGLRYLVTDKRWVDGGASPVFRPFREDTALAATAHYRNALADRYPSRRNALFGYNLGDEPGMKDTHAVKAWLSHFKRRDGSKLAFVNLLPSYGFPSRAAYEAYLEAYLRDPSPDRRPDVACFDHYPFFRDGRVRRDYFYNLRIVAQKAEGRPLWAFVQSADHLDYVDPAPEHLRFMVFCPVAFGAKGIGYFTYGRPEVEGYRDALVNNCSAPTAKYHIAKSVNFYVQKIIGPIVMNCVHRGAFHVSAKPTGEKDVLLNAGNAPLVAAVGNENCLVGMFQSKNPSDVWYFLMVNKSLLPAGNIEVTFKAPVSGRLFQAPPLAGFNGNTAYSPVSMGAGGKKMVIPAMLGGEGRLFKITGVTDGR